MKLFATVEDYTTYTNDGAPGNVDRLLRIASAIAPTALTILDAAGLWEGHPWVQ